MQADLPESAATSPVNILTSNSSSQPSRKRKATSSGSRGVASLTPEQLAKKRANDRDAQRAIRERTKQTIEGLERRIRDLESAQPYQELQVVLRQKESIQAENDEIRRRLTNVLAIIQPVVGAQRLTDLASAAHHNVQAGLAQPGNAFQPEPFLNDAPRPYPDTTSLPQGQTAPYIFPPDASSGSDNRGWQSSRDSVDQQRDNIDRGLTLSDSSDRGTFNLLLSSLGQRDSSQVPTQQGLAQLPAARPTYPAIGNQPYASSEPIWQQLPKHVEPTCTLDSILIDFYHAQRATELSNPVSSDQIPAYPSVSYLLNPSSSHAQRIDPVSELMTNIISKFPNISALPEQAAVLLAMFYLVRWQLNPTEENYLRMPEWMQPTEAQLDIPHPAWIDFLHWPRMRDKMVANYQDFLFDNWFIPYTVAISVNWPYEPSDCLLKMPLGAAQGDADDADDAEVIFNPVFERHVRRLENWSVSPTVIDAFPTLEGTCTVRLPAAKEQDSVVTSAIASAATTIGTTRAGVGTGAIGATAGGRAGDPLARR
ncbi:hypothetical protein DV736_g5703, partial [Chaetothyriales sp. CBS 134916]